MPPSDDTDGKPASLFDYTEDELMDDNKLTHYEILNVPHHATPDQVKKAYRKSSLKYHPDKTGRGQEDYVFLAVKRAYDHLMDPVKRQAYDSTVLFFDETVPPPREKLLADAALMYTDDDFYGLFGPIFERNLRFDARLRPDIQSKAKTSAKRKSFQLSKPPQLGDANTPMIEVHSFYEYWIHFESWRDFSAQAADELEVENDLENAESRYEKRWIQQQVDKRAKQLKKAELNRIQLLVERAMDADPRLRLEKQAEREAKEKAKQDRIEEEERKRQEEILKQQQAEADMEAEKLAKQQEKLEREQQKKHLRKARQLLRRTSSNSFRENGLYKDQYEMEQDVELLCTILSLDELTILNELVDNKEGIECLAIIKTHVEKAGNGNAAECDESKTSSPLANGPATNANVNGSRKETNPWTSHELSALAKAVKKYPGAGANRWDTICSYINSLCQQDIPRTKEECIEKFNQVARQSTKVEPSNGAANGKPNGANAAASPGNGAAASSPDDWSTEQDQQLQDGLGKFPATMDKNERWAAIAKGVTGKTKKDCVQRFKEIRDAIKSKN
ncbi:hypothetical protein MPSEU_001054100 [Mayamaea pseudoterrestris]|nr:hypothetical protein MPSEU_001054100 [Mayamaea pseudoterrestris]